jgi:hypothetical protein
MRVFRIIGVVLLVAIAGVAARAEETPSPEAIATASELLSITTIDIRKQLMTQINRLVWPAIEQELARSKAIDDATVAELRTEVEHIQLQELNELMKAAPPIYARHFTVDELHQLIAFYRTPLGNKALHEMPLVLGEFVTAIAPRLQEIQTQAADAADKVLRAHGYLK